MKVNDQVLYLERAYHRDGMPRSASAKSPSFAVTDGTGYGMGMFRRPWGPECDLWPLGLLCFLGWINPGRHAVQWQTGGGVVAAHQVGLNCDQLRALDAAFVGAV